MKTITKNTRINALIAALLIAIFAPQYTWAMAPAASRTAVLTGQLPARLAAQRAAQLAPALYPAAARLGLTGRSGTPAQISQNAEFRAQQREQEQRLARARNFTTRAQTQLQEARRAQLRSHLENSELERRQHGMTNLINSRGMGLASYAPGAGSMLTGRPAGTRAFSSASLVRSGQSVHAKTQQIIEACEKRLPQTLEWIDATLSYSNEIAAEFNSFPNDFKFIRDTKDSQKWTSGYKKWKEWKYMEKNKTSQPQGLLSKLLGKKPDYQTYQTANTIPIPPEINTVEEIFENDNNGKLLIKSYQWPSYYTPKQIEGMRLLLAGLLTGESSVFDLSGKKQYMMKKGEGWIYRDYDYDTKTYKAGRKVETSGPIFYPPDVGLYLVDALAHAARKANPQGYRPNYSNEELQWLAKTFTNDPDKALDILTAWYAVKTKTGSKSASIQYDPNTGKAGIEFREGSGFQHEDTREKRKTWNWKYEQEEEQDIYGKTAYQKYKAEQENSRKQPHSQSSRTGLQQSAPRNPLEAKFDADLADFEAGKKSYVDMVKAWHPDPEQDPELKAFKTEKMKVINSARK